MDQSERPNAPQPVAYDADGNPLYASPEQAASTPPTHQFVHMVRAVDPEPFDVSPEVQKRHEDSVARYPDLNLSPNEYIVSAVTRHPIGLLGPAFMTTFSVAIVLTMLFNIQVFMDTFALPEATYGLLLVGGIMLIALFLLVGYVALWVYLNNRFFLTNESVIQEIQTGLFHREEQTVSLANVEDASYSQRGPIQTFLNYGSIRLSTEGDETTYRFAYVANPKYHIAILNNAVEAFKNGRPVGQSVEDILREKYPEQGQLPPTEDD